MRWVVYHMDVRVSAVVFPLMNPRESQG